MKRLLLLSALLASNVACDGTKSSECNKQDLLRKLGHQVTVPDVKVAYIQHIKPLVDTHCLQCHAKGQQAPFMDSWEDISENDNELAKKMVKQVLLGDMPKTRPLDTASARTFELWRDNDYAEKNETQGLNCTPTQNPVGPVLTNGPQPTTEKDNR